MGVVGGAAVARRGWLRLQPPPAATWPPLAVSALPARQRAILRRVPGVVVDQAGRLTYRGEDGEGEALPAALPAAPTQWNREHANRWDRLESGTPWAIVLHWFGDDPEDKLNLASYLHGFDGLRQVSGYETRTSAHALVGRAHPAEAEEGVAIVQTQLPYPDGTPLVASHLPMLDYASHQARQQYFVRALYELSEQEPTVHSVLQDWFDGPWVDPNMRSLGIEITGRDFDAAQTALPDQQVANVVAVVAALMLRYNIRGSNLLGHLEIQTSKPDPGKKFMALVRSLLGSLALTSGEARLKELLFGQYLGTHGDAWQAVRTYFQLGRDTLVLTGRPMQVYEWEAYSGHWWLADQLPGHTHTPIPAMRSFLPPLPGASISPEATFTNPHNHAGVDLYLAASGANLSADVLLGAPGLCLYSGPVRNQHRGTQAFFRHRQADGAEFLSHYANLSSVAGLENGRLYPAGEIVGQVDSGVGKTFGLHFGVAYGAAWETTLRANPEVPLNASVGWIRERFMDAGRFLEERGGESG